MELINAQNVMKKRKIGLLTYHHTTNFGSLLQTYALYVTVKEFGYDCEIVDYRNEAVEKREFLTKHIYQCKTFRELKNHVIYSRFSKKKSKAFSFFFQKNFIVSEKTFYKDTVKNSNDMYDTFLVGSDLVWDFTINENDTTYMLKFADDKSTKIAFASSVGQLWNNERDEVKRLLNRFNGIGVREHAIQNELNLMLDRNVDFVCDPTMLLSETQWREMSAERCILEDYVLCYMSNAGQTIYRDAVAYGKKHGLPVYLISTGWVPDEMKPIRPNRPEEFLSLICYADTVFTASYHGMLFSLYFNKNFYYYNRGWKERMKSIAETLNITDREEWSIEKDNRLIDYNLINQKISEFRKTSLQHLKQYLKEGTEA